MDILHSSSQGLLASNSTSLIEPIMQGLTSLFLLGTFAFQSILGYPGSSRVQRENVILKRAVDNFVATEEPIALEKLLANIGSTGSRVQGAASGVVVASPSKSDPDCMYTCLTFLNLHHVYANYVPKTSILGPEMLLLSFKL